MSIDAKGHAYESALRALSEAGVRFVAVGSFARHMRGMQSSYNDIDIVYDTSADNIRLLKLALGSLVVDASSIEGADFSEPKRNVLLLDNGQSIDLLPRLRLKNWEYLGSGSSLMEAFGGEVAVCSTDKLEMLRMLKEASELKAMGGGIGPDGRVCKPIVCNPCETCQDGECKTTCNKCQTCVNGSCVDKPCGPCETCVSGTCVPHNEGAMCENNPCRYCQGGSCVDVPKNTLCGDACHKCRDGDCIFLCQNPDDVCCDNGQCCDKNHVCCPDGCCDPCTKCADGGGCESILNDCQECKDGKPKSKCGECEDCTDG
jgi:hypothetical protein